MMIHGQRRFGSMVLKKHENINRPHVNFEESRHCARPSKGQCDEIAVSLQLKPSKCPLRIRSPIGDGARRGRASLIVAERRVLRTMGTVPEPFTPGGVLARVGADGAAMVAGVGGGAFGFGLLPF